MTTHNIIILDTNLAAHAVLIAIGERVLKSTHELDDFYYEAANRNTGTSIVDITNEVVDIIMKR